MTEKITYFTPTFNREHLLQELYKSLVNQKNKSFIWLIVDDGSKDNTKKNVEKWIRENKIKIEYFYQENSGKNRAIDYAHKNCKTSYICCVDSDDKLSEDATDVLYYYINKFENDNEIVGFVGPKSDYNKKILGGGWPEKETKLFFKELLTKYNYSADTFLVFKTNIVKNFSFPIINGEKFVTESVLYNQFMYDYKLIAFDEKVYLVEYQPDGYSAQGLNLFFKNPKGYLYALKQNAFYAILNKESFKHKIYLSACFYGWKKFNKIKDEKIDYKIKFPYNVLGKILGYTFCYKKYKDSYETGYKN